MNGTLFGPWSSDMTTALTVAGLMLLKMTVVLLAAHALTLAMRRASAGARHLVWLVGLGATLVLPALALWGPVPLRVLPAPAAPMRLESAASVLDAPSLLPNPAASSTHAVDATSHAGARPSAAVETSASGPTRRGGIGLGALALALWSLGAFGLLARLAIGAWSVRRIVRRARALDRDDWRNPLYEIADRLGLSEAPDLLQSDRVKIPFASGLLKGRIVLPAESDAWSPERRTAVLMHELGHVRRRDLVGHTVSRVVCAIYWFHPLVWHAARRLRAESERACDDLALGLGARPSEYAEHLLEIVTQVRDPRTPAVALAMANPNEFEGRMLAILDPRVRRQGLNRAQSALLVGSIAVAALVVGVVSPAPRATAKPADSASLEPVDRSAASDDRRLDERHIDRAAPADEASPPDEAAPADEPDPPAEADEAVAMAESEDESDDSESGAGSKQADAAQRVAILTKALRTDTSPEVRRLAAWGLERYAHADAAAAALSAALAGDANEEVREMSAWALGSSRGPSSAVNALTAAFQRDKSAEVRRTATWAAGSIGHPAAVPALAALMTDANADVREAAAWAIGSCNADRAPATLVRALSDAHPSVRLSVAWALYEISDPSTADELEAAFHREKDPEVQHGLIRALGAMGDRAVDTLTRLVASPDPEIRAVAITALAGGNASGPWPWPRPEPRPHP